MPPTLLIPKGADIPDSWKKVSTNLNWNSTLKLTSFFSPGSKTNRPDLAAFEGATKPILIFGNGELDNDALGELAERAREKQIRDSYTPADLLRKTISFREKLAKQIDQVLVYNKRNHRTGKKNLFD